MTITCTVRTIIIDATLQMSFFSRSALSSAWISAAIMYIPKALFLAWPSTSGVLAANQSHTLPLIVNNTGSNDKYVKVSTSFATAVASLILSPLK